MPKKKLEPIASAAVIEQLPLAAFTEKAYLDYSMYVILDRALPFIGDGLKPVQRRIIYAMSELGLKATAKYKKSARTIGDVLGKFHPHGDVACYEAMVLMAQSFSYRYPLIDGQGNWGSADDPKSFAAMRYTEARLTPYAQLLLNEMQQGTIDWVPNFDGTLKEPAFLPTRLPNILLNGTSGIAVGMATDIPPHNLSEVTDACIYLLENPKASIADVCQFIKGPDFSTKAEIITPAEEILEIYTHGNGTIRARATYTCENSDIIITALPHQVSGSKILEQIAAQMLAKKLPSVTDLRDESDHENPTRLIITPRSNRVDVEQLMAHLFATTDLERTYRINLNMIGLNGKPKVENLLSLLQQWLQFRVQTITRRLKFRLEQVIARLHILQGLLIAFLNIDEIIAIIRQEDEPKSILMKRFKLSEQQAEAILEIKLKQLAKLEEQKIRAEEKELAEERNELENILASSRRLNTLIKKELKADKEQYGDRRNSPIVQRPAAQAMSEQDIIPAEAITVILSKQGWIRTAKGHDIKSDSLSYRAGDSFLSQAFGKSNESVILLDSYGQSYSLLAHTLPSARGHGEPVTGRVNPAPDAHFIGVLMGAESQYVLLASDYGYGFITQLKNLLSKSRSGKTILKLPPQAKVLSPQLIKDLESQYVAALSSEGYLLLFPIANLPELARGKGNKIINVPSAKLQSREETCVAIAVLSETSTLTIYSGKRHLTLKPKDLVHFQGERGRRGHKLPRGFRHVDNMVVDDET